MASKKQTAAVVDNGAATESDLDQVQQDIEDIHGPQGPQFDPHAPSAPESDSADVTSSLDSLTFDDDADEEDLEEQEDGSEDGEADGESAPAEVALPSAAVQAMNDAVHAANTDFEGEATNLHEVTTFIAAAYAQQGVDVKEVRKQVSAFRQAYLGRRQVLLTRQFDEIRDEVAEVNPASTRSVTSRIDAVLAATKQGLLDKGFDEETANEVARIMAEAQKSSAPARDKRLAAARTYRASNPERVQERLALRKAAAALARGE